MLHPVDSLSSRYQNLVFNIFISPSVSPLARRFSTLLSILAGVTISIKSESSNAPCVLRFLNIQFSTAFLQALITLFFLNYTLGRS